MRWFKDHISVKTYQYLRRYRLGNRLRMRNWQLRRWRSKFLGSCKGQAYKGHLEAQINRDTIVTSSLKFYPKKMASYIIQWHDDIIKWKHFLRYWPFVWGIHRSPVNSPHKGQWRGALMFSLICAWLNEWTIVRLVIWDATALIMTSLKCYDVIAQVLLERDGIIYHTMVIWPHVCLGMPRWVMCIRETVKIAAKKFNNAFTA